MPAAADRVLAVLQAVTPFGVEQEALPGVAGRRQREVVVGRQRPVVRQRRIRAELAE